ncbi:MAG TPA: hypothetical protein VF503_14565 [Sphingobium sp.]|uniref:hypothetical protein n=1 Tax=Sphingobium sp. TaxID=1912891 RepID=UPI002ED0AFA7
MLIEQPRIRCLGQRQEHGGPTGCRFITLRTSVLKNEKIDSNINNIDEKEKA